MTCPISLLQGRLSQRRAVARAVDHVHPDAHFESMWGFADSYWCVHVQDNFRHRGF